MNIQEPIQKVKELKSRINTREIYTILLIFVVGFGSFGLGRLSKLQNAKAPIRLQQPTVLPAVPSSGAENASAVSLSGATAMTSTTGTKNPSPASGQLVASKGGTKYHFPWCSGAQRISEANKIWFNSVEEARKAGYTPASNCKGLK